MRRALAIALLVGCSGPAPRPVDPIVITHVNRACLTRPPPPAPQVPFDRAPACPGPYVLCLRFEGAKVLLAYLDEVYEYGLRAWTMCGTAPTETK